MPRPGARKASGWKPSSSVNWTKSTHSPQLPRRRPPPSPERVRDRVRDQIAALLDPNSAIAEDRLAQEVAYLAARADIREEIDRLVGHVASARELLSGGGPVGRRLDFLCQEFNREANTLCSKSADKDLTRIGLDLKAAVEGLREQVQNIE